VAPSIRHYWPLASGNLTTRLERARALLGGGPPADFDADDRGSDPDETWPALLVAVAHIDVALCPRCGERTVCRSPLPSPLRALARAPPEATP
jgi:hypothetical protein